MFKLNLFYGIRKIWEPKVMVIVLGVRVQGLGDVGGRSAWCAVE